LAELKTKGILFLEAKVRVWKQAKNDLPTLEEKKIKPRSFLR